ncbi:hypothetical protein RFI_17833, partial [Reticulomyxa filosa]
MRRKQMGTEKVAETRLELVVHLAEILCKLTSASEMQTLLPILIRGVNDSDEQACLGTCKALQGLLRERANETKEYLTELIKINLEEIRRRNNDNSPVSKQQLHMVCILTREHFDSVMDYLHKVPIPVPREVILLFKALVEDEPLRKKVIDYEIRAINDTPISMTAITPPVHIVMSIAMFSFIYVFIEIHFYHKLKTISFFFFFYN